MPLDTLVIDFETFYTREYSLSKMTTQEYVLSEFFEIILVSVKRNDEAAVWFSGTKEATREWLAQFDWENSRAIAHNALFDGAVLEWVLDIHPKEWFCTLFGARPLAVPFTPRGRCSLAVLAEYYQVGVKGTEVVNAIGFRRRDFSPQHLQKYADYCCVDSDLTYRIYQLEVRHLPRDEQSLIHETVRKYTRPLLRLNRDVLTAQLAKLQSQKLAVLHDAGLTDNKILMSNPKFAEALENLGVSPPLKISKTTGLETFAFAKTDPGMKELLEHPDFRVQALVAARVKHKSTQEETRLERFLAITALDATGIPLGVPLKYYGAHTGRFSGADGLNLQNLPRGGELRRSVEAPPGYILVAADLSQIEARITAVLAGQHDLVAAYAAGRDVYCDFGTDTVFKRTITKADVKERFICKTAILGLGFGLGAEVYKAALAASVMNVVITTKEAQRIVWDYRRRYAEIPKLWSSLDTALHVMCNGGMMEVGPLQFCKGHVRLPNGLSIFYPNLRADAGGLCFDYRGQRKSIWGGGLTENVVQALARIILGIAELRLARRGLHAVLQVHDELVYCVKIEHAEMVKKALRVAMQAKVAFMPELPVACEVKVGYNYLEMKEER